MSMFFCDGCQQFRDMDYVGFNVAGDRELCDDCHMEREAAAQEFAEKESARVMAENERRLGA